MMLIESEITKMYMWIQKERKLYCNGKFLKPFIHDEKLNRNFRMSIDYE